jgi:hypothetical protein
MRCEERTLDDIRALGGNDAEDERRFAAAAKVSEINLALYRTFLRPYVRAMLSPPVSELIEMLHPCGCRTRPFQMIIRSWRQ